MTRDALERLSEDELIELDAGSLSRRAPDRFTHPAASPARRGARPDYRSNAGEGLFKRPRTPYLSGRFGGQGKMGGQ